jgi:ribonuclease HI
MLRETLLIEIQKELYQKRLHNMNVIDALLHMKEDTLEKMLRDISSLTKSDSSSESLYIFTDGACSKNGSKAAKGGWGCFVTNDKDSEYNRFNCFGTVSVNPTNQKAELTAILQAVRMVRQNANSIKEKSIVVCSDSMYSINCCSKWYKSWEKNNWKNSKKEDVKNAELIKDIISVIKDLHMEGNIKVTFKHVYSHLREPQNKNTFDHFLWHGNNEADNLASSIIRN